MSSIGTGETSSSEGREFAWMWLAIRKHLGKIVVIVLVASMLATAFILTRTKEYTAYTDVLIGPNTNDFGNLEEDNDQRSEGISPADMESEVRLVSSSHVVQNVIKELDLSFDDPSWDLKTLVLNWLRATPARSETAPQKPLLRQSF